MNISNLSIRLVVALLTCSVGVAVAVISTLPHLRTKSVPIVLKVSAAPQDNEKPFLAGWKRITVKDKVAMQLPTDMKPIEPIGDALCYREAYGNRDLSITIVYGDILRAPIGGHSQFAECETPRALLERPTYQESVIVVDGRKAMIGIDRDPHQPITAVICFQKAESATVPLRIVAFCKDSQSLETAQQIFTSVRFIDNP